LQESYCKVYFLVTKSDKTMLVRDMEKL